jgi:hypothetical protein
VILGGIPIYIDKEFREEAIPEGTGKVEMFYDGRKRLDLFEFEKSEDEFICDLKERRKEHLMERAGKFESWLDR